MPDFDPTIPVNGTEADADEIRSNFNQLAIHHTGSTAPTAPAQGYIWLDTSNAANHILKVYDEDAWRDLFDNCESTPVPSSGGGGSGDVSFSSGYTELEMGSPGPVPSPPDPASQWAATGFKVVFAHDGLVLESLPTGYTGANTSNWRVPASSISAEVGPTVTSDPSGIISSAELYTDGDGYRQLRTTASGNSGTAYVAWTWKGATFTAKIVALSS